VAEMNASLEQLPQGYDGHRHDSAFLRLIRRVFL